MAETRQLLEEVPLPVAALTTGMFLLRFLDVPAKLQVVSHAVLAC